MARPSCMYQGHQRVDTLRVTAWSGVPLQTLCRVDKLVVMSLDNKALWKVMQGQALTCGYGGLWFVLSMSYQTNRPRMGPTDMRCLYSYASTVHVELVQHATIRGKYFMPAGNPLGYFRGVTISASRFTTLVSFGFRKRTRSKKKKKKTWEYLGKMVLWDVFLSYSPGLQYLVLFRASARSSHQNKTPYSEVARFYHVCSASC